MAGIQRRRKKDLSQMVLSPSISPDENSRDVILDSYTASKVLAHLEKYEYASIQHVAIALMWYGMMRVGGVHAMDVDDHDPDNQCVKVRHRPGSGTPIKNQGKGERMGALSDQLCDVLDDWLAERRPSVTDEHGREQLLASREDRTNKTTLERTSTGAADPAPTALSVRTTALSKSARPWNATPPTIVCQA